MNKFTQVALAATGITGVLLARGCVEGQRNAELLDNCVSLIKHAATTSREENFPVQFGEPTLQDGEVTMPVVRKDGPLEGVCWKNGTGVAAGLRRR